MKNERKENEPKLYIEDIYNLDSVAWFPKYIIENYIYKLPNDFCFKLSKLIPSSGHSQTRK